MCLLILELNILWISSISALSSLLSGASKNDEDESMNSRITERHTAVSLTHHFLL